MRKECNLKTINGRVILRMDAESKNRHTLTDGITIRRERGFNNFNFREVNPANAFVISSESLPIGAEVLIDYTSFHDTNRIFDYESGSIDVHYYSVREEECYAWRVPKKYINENGETVHSEWHPMPKCEFGLRVFKPYEGKLNDIKPTRIKDTLLALTGEFKNKIIKTVRGADYQIVFQGDDNREASIIRFRSLPQDDSYDKEEVLYVDNYLTEDYFKGKLLAGFEINDAKYFE